MGVLDFLAGLSKPFTDLGDFVREADERNAKEDALERRKREINLINAESRQRDSEKENKER